MKSGIYPCLWFDGKAKEAAAFLKMKKFDIEKLISA